MTVNLVFLGKRGGGSVFLRGGARFAENLNLDVNIIYSSNNEDADLEEFLGNRFVIPIPHSFLRVFCNPIKLARDIFKVRKILRIDASINIFLLPSPFDWALFTLNNKKNAWYFIIHDADRHPGEKWPRVKSISWRVKASRKIITLSEFVSKKIVVFDPGKKAIIIPHPRFEFFYHSQSRELFLPPQYILFIGRIRDYKGLDVLLDAMKKIDSVTLVIAGEGVVPTHELKNVFILNKWMSESEILYLIQNALCIVFPYREASQSGLLPLAMSLDKRIVATEVGALSEQLGDYVFKHLVAPSDVESLISGIQLAISQSRKSEPISVEKDSTVEELFTMERFFQKLFKTTLD